MKIRYAAFCETGNREGANQDRIFAAASAQNGLFLVADGMGGHSDGAFASSCVREETERLWRKLTEDPEAGRNTFYTEELCIQALKKTNDRILTAVYGRYLCGSTAVLLHIGQDEFSLFTCGDSRCYRFKKSFLFRRLVQISMDDVWENSAEAKLFSREEMKRHKNRGKLCRAVGTEKEFSCRRERFCLQREELLILCSDGIYKYIPERFLAETVKKAEKNRLSLTEAAEKIRNAVYEAGAPDNLSLILIRAEKK